MAEKSMVKKIVAEIESSLKNGNSITALMTALTLPDICGKVEYGDTMHGKQRYIHWFDSYIPHGFSPFFDQPRGKNLPELSGEIVYLLRCSLLHEGSINIEKNKIKCIDNRFDYFALYNEPPNENDIYLTILRRSPNSKAMIVGIRGLCMILAKTASAYYDQYKEKFEEQESLKE